jgi:Fe-S-cluster containining protein
MRAAGAATTASLRDQSGPGGRQAAFGSLAGLLDLKMAEHSTPAIDCRRGCEHCCHRVISVTPPEVSAVTEYVADRFAPEQKRALTARLRTYLDEVAPHQGRDLYHLRPRCPFLEGGFCSVYAVRPLSCRAQFSTDVSACAAARSDPSLAFPETQEAILDRAATSGVLSALASAGRPANPLDLGRAVYMRIAYGEGASDDALPSLDQFAVPAWERQASPPPNGPGSYPNYGADGEPVGTVNTSDLAEARYWLAEGDVERAFAAAPNVHPAHRLFRRLSSPVLQTEEEVESGRVRFDQAFREFVEMPADPRQKFDAVSEFSTLRLSYLQGDDRALLAEIGDFETFELTESLLPDLCEPLGNRHAGKLRVGYIGNQLDGSSSGFWPTGWLRRHGPDIEKFVFDVGPPDRRPGDLYRALADHFFCLPGPVPETARFIKSHDLDVLIYPDLASRGRPIQFATMRLARVQCAGWGGPGTTGLPNIDYFLSGDYMEPANGEEHYRERLVRLPRTGLCYPAPPAGVPRFEKADFGLDDGPLILCAQTASKLLPQWDFVFREICERTGRTILFFRYPQWPYWRLEHRLREAGVRAIFMPVYSPEVFRALLRLADVALDSIGWSGGITAIETVGAGLPTVTMPREFRRSRHTTAFLTAANAPGLIARDIEDYVDLATNPERRREAVREMEPAALFEDKGVVAALDEFLRSTAA